MAFWPLFVLLLITFAVMVGVMRYVLIRHYMSATAHLQSLSAEYSQRHEELKRRVEEAEHHYQEQMQRAKQEAEQFILQARREADTVLSECLDGARKESEQIVQQALDTRDALRKELEQAMETRAVERACEIIQFALPEPVRREMQTHWIQEIIHNGLAQLERLKGDESAREATVVSAFPLTPEQRSILQERLKGQLGRDLVVNMEVDERLVAGLTISVGSRILDASLASRIRQAARHAQDAS